MKITEIQELIKFVAKSGVSEVKTLRSILRLLQIEEGKVLK